MKTFEEFNAEVGNRKTGYYGNGVDMYTKRDGSNERVFCVKWFERNSKYPTHKDWKKAQRLCSNKYISEWVEKRQLFAYTPQGLEAALEFVQSDLMSERYAAWYNREQ